MRIQQQKKEENEPLMRKEPSPLQLARCAHLMENQRSRAREGGSLGRVFLLPCLSVPPCEVRPWLHRRRFHHARAGTCLESMLASKVWRGNEGRFDQHALPRLDPLSCKQALAAQDSTSRPHLRDSAGGLFPPHWPHLDRCCADSFSEIGLRFWGEPG